MLKKIRSSTCSIRRKSIFVFATADSPLGPFKQDEHKPIREEKSIDTSVFFDEDGKAYLYFVRFNDGNVIWCAELKENLKEIKEETLTQCFKAEEPWELVLPKVVEGPSVFKSEWRLLSDLFGKRLYKPGLCGRLCHIGFAFRPVEKVRRQSRVA